MSKFKVGDKIKLSREATVMHGPDEDGDWKISAADGEGYEYLYASEIGGWDIEVLRAPFQAGDVFVANTGTMDTTYVRDTEGRWRYWYHGWKVAMTNDEALDEPDSHEWATICRRGGVDLDVVAE